VQGELRSGNVRGELRSGNVRRGWKRIGRMPTVEAGVVVPRGWDTIRASIECGEARASIPLPLEKPDGTAHGERAAQGLRRKRPKKAGRGERAESDCPRRDFRDVSDRRVAYANTDGGSRIRGMPKPPCRAARRVARVGAESVGRFRDDTTHPDRPDRTVRTFGRHRHPVGPAAKSVRP
jgi:hypothetical protein